LLQYLTLIFLDFVVSIRESAKTKMLEGLFLSLLLLWGIICFLSVKYVLNFTLKKYY